MIGKLDGLELEVDDSDAPFVSLRLDHLHDALVNLESGLSNLIFGGFLDFGVGAAGNLLQVDRGEDLCKVGLHDFFEVLVEVFDVDVFDELVRVDDLVGEETFDEHVDTSFKQDFMLTELKRLLGDINSVSEQKTVGVDTVSSLAEDVSDTVVIANADSTGSDGLDLDGANDGILVELKSSLEAVSSGGSNVGAGGENFHGSV